MAGGWRVTGADIAWLIVVSGTVVIALIIAVTYLIKPWE